MEESNDQFSTLAFWQLSLAGKSLPHAACAAVADQQGGSSYNPLLLYGGSKTHLMRDWQPRPKTFRLKADLCSGERFLNEFIDTIGKRITLTFAINIEIVIYCWLMIFNYRRKKAPKSNFSTPSTPYTRPETTSSWLVTNHREIYLSLRNDCVPVCQRTHSRHTTAWHKPEWPYKINVQGKHSFADRCHYI